ncbi:Histidine phosphatase superfamily (branch 1) [Carex littledalei]|uniref:Histidine phosphatase superfamily (Branch 1) n=1 Tax=Carex littledalei TaxID=544730 RepID=A0A833QII5_9POAL|nr:Histidine phosphatase superfamily (branch 1) [Carex littledalei]
MRVAPNPSLSCSFCGFASPQSVPGAIPKPRFRLGASTQPARSVSVSTPTTSATAEESATPTVTSRRRLILLRHGESAFAGRFTKDHDRPLSQVGRNDAISISHKLEQMGWIPELILSSNATRTKETLEILREKIKGLNQAKVHFIPSFYSIAAMDGQTAAHLQKAICEFSTDEISTVMCMGHNKGWEEAASMFSGDPVELKTCNAALLEASGQSWMEAFSVAGLGGWKLHGILKP